MMRYNVYGIVTGTKYIGEFEAASKEEAVEIALQSKNNNFHLCCECSGNVELDEMSCQDAHAEEVE